MASAIERDMCGLLHWPVYDLFYSFTFQSVSSDVCVCTLHYQHFAFHIHNCAFEPIEISSMAYFQASCIIIRYSVNEYNKKEERTER